MDALTAWTSDDEYETRVAAIDLLLAVDDDHEVESITGSSGRDLFYQGLGDLLTDVGLKNELETVL